jgi:hypothetical protein
MAVPIHPVLVAAFPVLFLFAQNAEQQVTLAPLWLPLGAALGAAVVALLALGLLLRDWLRGALVASLWLALFFSFGHAWNVIGHVFDGRRYLIAIYVVVALVGAVLVWRGGPWVRPLTRFLNGAALLLVLFNVVRVGDFALGSLAAAEPASTPPPGIVAGDERPDIYYIILDRYANEQTLEEIYGFDNTPFLDALEERGFTIAHDSWANYLKTAYSLVSSLNMEYLDPALYDTDDPPSWAPLYAALRERMAVPATLKSLGYEYVHLGNYWEPTGTNVDADFSLRYQEASEFSAALGSTTALMLLSPLGVPDDDPETVPLADIAVDTTLYTFERLEEAAGRPGPTYVFAHLLVPHPPYVFNADGSIASRELTLSRPETERYNQQLQWTNTRVLQALDRLLDKPEDEQPIIILQADEGPWPPGFSADQVNFQWLEATPEEVQQKMGILNAFHLPGVDDAAAGVHDRISPVNAFRIVFNAYFGADLPLLPDISYLSPDYARKYDFHEYPRD